MSEEEEFYDDYLDELPVNDGTMSDEELQREELIEELRLLHVTDIEDEIEAEREALIQHIDRCNTVASWIEEIRERGQSEMNGLKDILRKVENELLTDHRAEICIDLAVQALLELSAESESADEFARKHAVYNYVEYHELKYVIEIDELAMHVAEVFPRYFAKKDERERILEQIREDEYRKEQIAKSPLKQAQQIDFDALAMRYPHMTDAVDHMRRECALSKLTGHFSLSSPIILLGEPGCGKSDFAMHFAELTGIENRFVDAATQSAGWIITGLDSSWRGGKTGLIHELVMCDRVHNAIIIFDEIDKATGDSQRPIQPALGGLLEPLTARKFTDEFERKTFDASHINVIMTANTLDTIEPHIRDRCHVIECRQPNFAERCQIICVAWLDVIHSEPWAEYFDVDLADDVIEMLADSDQSIRSCVRQLRSAAAEAAIRTEQGDDIAIAVDDVLRVSDRSESGRIGIGFVQSDSKKRSSSRRWKKPEMKREPIREVKLTLAEMLEKELRPTGGGACT